MRIENRVALGRKPAEPYTIHDLEFHFCSLFIFLSLCISLLNTCFTMLNFLSKSVERPYALLYNSATTIQSRNVVLWLSFLCCCFSISVILYYLLQVNKLAWTADILPISFYHYNMSTTRTVFSSTFFFCFVRMMTQQFEAYSCNTHVDYSTLLCYYFFLLHDPSPSLHIWLDAMCSVCLPVHSIVRGQVVHDPHSFIFLFFFYSFYIILISFGNFFNIYNLLYNILSYS